MEEMALLYLGVLVLSVKSGAGLPILSGIKKERLAWKDDQLLVRGMNQMASLLEMT
jgi:hypothetical protein